MAVFDSPVAAYLLHFARECGYETLLLEPGGADRVPHAGDYAHHILTRVGRGGLGATECGPEGTDVVVTDHDRDELGETLRDVLAVDPRWVGVMGSPRHVAPHERALADLGVADETIARVHRPIGLNIGSRTPPEIALATLAGLIADRQGRPGGFDFG